jgi:hypothetical protein
MHRAVAVKNGLLRISNVRRGGSEPHDVEDPTHLLRPVENGVELLVREIVG